MKTNDEELDKKQDQPDDDTEGHGLLLDTDYYTQRKSGRDAEFERAARERQLIKEARTNKPERR